jgi:hypothetical protein
MTVRAVVEAYAAGTIELPKAKGREDQMRHAPHFTPGLAHGSDASPYTAETIQEFLGFKGDAGLNRIKDTLNALALIESTRTGDDGSVTAAAFCRECP